MLQYKSWLIDSGFLRFLSIKTSTKIDVLLLSFFYNGTVVSWFLLYIILKEYLDRFCWPCSKIISTGIFYGLCVNKTHNGLITFTSLDRQVIQKRVM